MGKQAKSDNMFLVSSSIDKVAHQVDQSINLVKLSEEGVQVMDPVEAKKAYKTNSKRLMMKKSTATAEASTTFAFSETSEATKKPS